MTKNITAFVMSISPFKETVIKSQIKQTVIKGKHCIVKCFTISIKNDDDAQRDVLIT